MTDVKRNKDGRISVKEARNFGEAAHLIHFHDKSRIHTEVEQVLLEACAVMWQQERATQIELKKLRHQVYDLKQPIPCGVCGGQPLKSGRQCVCNGVGTEAGEMQGLRETVFEYENKLREASVRIMACRDRLTNEILGNQSLDYSTRNALEFARREAEKAFNSTLTGA